MRDLLASPRFRFAGGVRVTVKTALVKTAINVAMVAERCVMMVAPGWLLEELASRRVGWIQLQYQKSWGGGIGQNDKKRMNESCAEKSVCLDWKLEGKEGQLLDSHNW